MSGWMNACIDSDVCFVAVLSLEFMALAGLLVLVHVLLGASEALARYRHRQKALELLEREVSE